MNTLNKTARTAGLLYVVYILMSVVADLFGRFVFADTAGTVAHILANETSFRIGFVISLFSVAIFVLAAWQLYVLLKPVNANLALLFLILNLGGFVIWCISLLNLYTGLVLLSGADYLKAFQPEQLQAQATLFINLRRSGAVIAQVPYGLWLLPLSYLVYKSGFLPKVLGILLFADFIAELIYVSQKFLLPGFDAIAYPCLVVSFIAELGLALWLLVKGVKEQNAIPAAEYSVA